VAARRRKSEICLAKPGPMDRPASAEGEPIGSPRPRANLRFAWLRASAFSVHPAPVPLFVNSVEFRGFSVGDGGGYYMGPIQPILFIFRVSV